MKAKKLISLWLTVALVAVTAFGSGVLSVSAADVEKTVVELGDFTASNNDNQKGWATNGYEGVATNLTMDDVKANKYLILELGEAPVGDVQFIWQGDGDADEGGSGWNQTDGVISGGTSAVIFIRDLSYEISNYDEMISGTGAKFFLGYYDDTIADLQIKRAYLSNVGEITPDPSWSLVNEWRFTNPDVDLTGVSASGGAEVNLAVTSASAYYYTASATALSVTSAGALSYDGVSFTKTGGYSFDANKAYSIVLDGIAGYDDDTFAHQNITIGLEYAGKDAAGDPISYGSAVHQSTLEPDDLIGFWSVLVPAADNGIAALDEIRVTITDTYDPAVSFELFYVAIYEYDGGGTDPIDPQPPAPGPQNPVMIFSFSSVADSPSFTDASPVINGASSVPYRTVGDSAILYLPTAKLNELMAKAVDGALVLDLSDVAGTGKVKIPRTALYTIGYNGLDVVIAIPGGSLTIAADTAKAIALAAKTGHVTFVLSPVDVSTLSVSQQMKLSPGDIVYDFAVLYDNYPIAYDGTIAISIPYEGALPAPSYIWVKGLNGNITKVNCTYNEDAGTLELEL
ncbi:MAG: hypothetical protein LBS21_04220 [Clostridiales bacterium]|nr:hypothetical protein [Clostridiales bacterium]